MLGGSFYHVLGSPARHQSLIGCWFLLRGRDADQRNHLRGCDPSVRGPAAGCDAPGSCLPPAPAAFRTPAATSPHATPPERSRNARTQTPSSSRWGRYCIINPRVEWGLCPSPVSNAPSCTSTWLRRFCYAVNRHAVWLFSRQPAQHVILISAVMLRREKITVWKSGTLDHTSAGQSDWATPMLTVLC